MIFEMNTNSSGSTCGTGISRNNRIRPTDPQSDDLGSRDRDQLKMISENNEANSVLTPEIVIRDKRAKPNGTQNDIRWSVGKVHVKTISESVDVGISERLTSLRNDRREATESFTNNSVTREVNDRQPAFRRIFAFGLVIGLPFSEILFSKKREHAKNWLKLWILGVTAARAVFVAIEGTYNHLLWPAFAVQFCYLSHCVIGNALAWIFLLRGRKIMASVRKCSSLMHFLNAESVDEIADPMRFYFPLSVTGVYFMSSIQLFFFFSSEWESQIERVKSFIPFPEDSAFFYVSCSLVFFSAIFSLNISLLTHYVALYLTGAAYRHSGHLFAMFGNKLKIDIEREHFTARTANESITQFQYVVSCAAEIENTFNAIAFVIYANVFLFCFAGLTLLLAKDQSYQAMEVNMLVTLCFKIGADMLVYLCCSGDHFYEPLEKLRKEIIPLSSSLMKQTSDDASTLVMFNMLARQIKEVNPCVTAWGFYDINARLVPNVVGALISYGVLLDRFGANANY